jgi:hypothetical protein
LTGSKSARPGRMAGGGHPWSPRVLSSVRGWARVRAAAAIGIPAQWGGCRAADRGASRRIDASPEGPLGVGRAGRVRPPGGPVGSRPGGLQRRGPIRVAGGVGRYSEARTGLGSVQALIASCECVDGHTRNCYSDLPVGTASQGPPAVRGDSPAESVWSSPLTNPAPTPAVVVCARSLLENGRVRAKSQCGQFTRTSVRLGCTSISSKAGLVGSRDFGPW